MQIARPELTPDASAFTELDIIHQRAKALLQRVSDDPPPNDNCYGVERHMYGAIEELRQALEAWGP